MSKGYRGKNCQGCGHIIKRVWKYKWKFYCFNCYQGKVIVMNFGVVTQKK